MHAFVAYSISKTLVVNGNGTTQSNKLIVWWLFRGSESGVLLSSLNREERRSQAGEVFMKPVKKVVE